jgi:hypothetical protein
VRYTANVGHAAILSISNPRRRQAGSLSYVRIQSLLLNEWSGAGSQPPNPAWLGEWGRQLGAGSEARSEAECRHQAMRSSDGRHSASLRASLPTRDRRYHNQQSLDAHNRTRLIVFFVSICTERGGVACVKDRMVHTGTSGTRRAAPVMDPISWTRKWPFLVNGISVVCGAGSVSRYGNVAF